MRETTDQCLSFKDRRSEVAKAISQAGLSYPGESRLSGEDPEGLIRLRHDTLKQVLKKIEEFFPRVMGDIRSVVESSGGYNPPVEGKYEYGNSEAQLGLIFFAGVQLLSELRFLEEMNSHLNLGQTKDA